MGVHREILHKVVSDPHPCRRERKCHVLPCRRRRRHVVVVDRAWYIYQQEEMAESVPTILLQMYLDQTGSLMMQAIIHGDETRRAPFAPTHTAPAIRTVRENESR